MSMSPDEMIAVIQAHKNGELIEHRLIGASGWCNGPAKWNFAHCEYRIAKKPKKRLIRVDELPDVIWIMNVKENPEHITAHLITSITWDEKTKHFKFSIEGSPAYTMVHDCVGEWSWSPGHKGPWKSFEIEEQEPCP